MLPDKSRIVFVAKDAKNSETRMLLTGSVIEFFRCDVRQLTLRRSTQDKGGIKRATGRCPRCAGKQGPGMNAKSTERFMRKQNCTGQCPGVWSPLLRKLASTQHVVALHCVSSRMRHRFAEKLHD